MNKMRNVKKQIKTYKNMPEAEKSQLNKVVLLSYRNWGCVIQFAWIIMDILDSMRWKADEALGDRREILNL